MPWVLVVSWPGLAGESWGLRESDKEDARDDRGVVVAATPGSGDSGVVNLFPESVPPSGSTVSSVVSSRSGSVGCGGGPGLAQDLW